jgi:predicted porin
MRKLLLATVAALGGLMGVAAVADAQSMSDTSGQAFPTVAGPTPGTVTVRLNGRFRFYAVAVADRNSDVTAPLTTPATPGTSASGGRQVGYSFGSYARLYPGFDGVAANGLKYGASLEIRQDNGGANARAGGGAVGSISGSNQGRGALYFRREWGYIGTDQLGTLRLGSIDSASSLYMTGNFENFNDGGLNGDLDGFASPNNQITWPFADVGNLYSTTKAVYLSPQFFGFDAGISYEPNTGAVLNGNHCDSGLGGSIGCERLGSTYNNAESGRRRNTIDALLRYRGTFGGFGIAATGGYIHSGNVKDISGERPFNSNRSTPGLGIRDNFDGLEVGDFGLALTYGGLSVGGKYQFGRFNGQWNLAPKGVADGEAFLGGASYTFGPVIVGAHYLNYKSAGDIGNAVFGRQRKEQGIAAGATYSLAPGLSIFLSYVGTERKQSGYNFATGAGVTPTAPGGNRDHNKVTAQVVGIGTSFSW